MGTLCKSSPSAVPVSCFSFHSCLICMTASVAVQISSAGNEAYYFQTRKPSFTAPTSIVKDFLVAKKKVNKWGRRGQECLDMKTRNLTDKGINMTSVLNVLTAIHKLCTFMGMWKSGIFLLEKLLLWLHLRAPTLTWVMRKKPAITQRTHTARSLNGIRQSWGRVAEKNELFMHFIFAAASKWLT